MDVLLGLEPRTVPIGTEVLVELMLLTCTITVGISIGVKMEVLPPLAIVWGCTRMVPRDSEEDKGLIVGFCMLLKYVKKGSMLSNDSLTTSITGSEIFKGGLAGSTVWFSNDSISNGARLSTVSIDGLGLG